MFRTCRLRRRVVLYRILMMIVLGLPGHSFSAPQEVLDGTFLVRRYDSAHDDGYIVMKGDGRVLGRPRYLDDVRPYHSTSIHSWFHAREAFIGKESRGPLRGPDFRSNLVVLNLAGEPTDTLYCGLPAERINNTYLSRQDSLAVFTVEPSRSSLGEHGFYSNFPFEPLSLRILEVKSRTVVTRIDGLFSNRHFEMAESPWSPDQSKLTYAIQKLLIADELIGDRDLTHSLWANREGGVFVYSLCSQEHLRIADSGYCAIWSPVEDKIAYMTEGSISLYDPDRDSTTILYEAGLSEVIRFIHWTPCGKYVFARHKVDWFGLGLLVKYDQKLIRIEDGVEVDFIRLPLYSSDRISWR